MLCRNIGIIQNGELVENTSMKGLLAKLKSETFILDLAAKSPLPKLDGYHSRLTDTSTLEVEVMREQAERPVHPTERAGRAGAEHAQQGEPPGRTVCHPG